MAPSQKVLYGGLAGSEFQEKSDFGGRRPPDGEGIRRHEDGPIRTPEDFPGPNGFQYGDEGERLRRELRFDWFHAFGGGYIAGDISGNGDLGESNWGKAYQ
ncbi:hypothetical protein AGMMS49991_03050 [Spirochaetia bacterium]|nr:hypothetical protein AGMMS49991_03050 [Spirochaetia bacterium]